MIKLVDYEQDHDDDPVHEAFETAKAEAARAAFREKFCRELYGVGYSVVKESSDDQVLELATQKSSAEKDAACGGASLETLKQSMAKQAFVKSSTMFQPDDSSGTGETRDPPCCAFNLAVQGHISSEYHGFEQKINCRFISDVFGSRQPHPLFSLAIAMETRFTDFLSGYLDETYFAKCLANANDQLTTFILSEMDEPNDWSVSFDSSCVILSDVVLEFLDFGNIVFTGLSPKLDRMVNLRMVIGMPTLLIFSCHQKNFVVRNKVSGAIFHPGQRHQPISSDTGHDAGIAHSEKDRKEKARSRTVSPDGRVTAVTAERQNVIGFNRSSEPMETMPSDAKVTTSSSSFASFSIAGENPHFPSTSAYMVTQTTAVSANLFPVCTSYPSFNQKQTDWTAAPPPPPKTEESPVVIYAPTEQLKPKVDTPKTVEIGPQLPPGFKFNSDEPKETEVDQEFEGLVAQLNSLVEVPEEVKVPTSPMSTSESAVFDSPATVKRKNEEELDKFLEELEKEIAPKKPKPVDRRPDQDLDELFDELTDLAGIPMSEPTALHNPTTSKVTVSESAPVATAVIAQSPRIFPEASADKDDSLGDEYAQFMAELGEAAFIPPEEDQGAADTADSADKDGHHGHHGDKKKKKKSTHLKSNLALKKKGIDSLVSRWQSVSESVRR